jgi:glyceraldehyde-3-phosphate dehydrogenase type I
MTKKIAINGLGRIGRLVLRHYVENPPENVEIIAANASAPTDQLAYVISHDSVHRKPPFEVSAGPGYLRLGDHRVAVVNNRDPSLLPWKELGVDMVLECTGVFKNRPDAAKHLAAGAKKVIISAPSATADLTIVLGVNEARYDPGKHHVVSNGSCTTNSLAPVAKVLNDSFGIDYLLMTTTHSYTSSQALIDKYTKDKRRGRAAAVSIIPSTTGAAESTALTIPELAGRMQAQSLRIPLPDGSITEIVAHLKKDVTVEQVNAAMRHAAEHGLKGIVEYSEDDLVSADIIGNPHSGIVDAKLTAVVAGRAVKMMVWYDNEYGYARRLLDLASYMAGRETASMQEPGENQDG